MESFLNGSPVVITVYWKRHCGWTEEVKEVLDRYNLEYEEKLIDDSANYEEMVRKSDQLLSPCVIINNYMLANIGGEEMEIYINTPKPDWMD